MPSLSRLGGVHGPSNSYRRHPTLPLLGVDSRFFVGLMQLVQVGGVVGGTVDEQIGGSSIEEPRTCEPRDETWLQGRRWLGGGGGRWRRGGGRGSRGGGRGGCSGWKDVVSRRGGGLEVEHAGGFAVVDEVDVWTKEVEVVAVR